MLQELRIRNYAIIDELDISFDSGLTIITGETGAGKSILMGALSLILGQRADSSIIVNKEKKTIVEGVFDVSENQEIRSFLETEELDQSEELLLRREIAPNGKSRAFINDTPASLTQLQNLALLLVDLHRQFDTLSLGSADFQMMVVDAMANNQIVLPSYQQEYLSWIKFRRDLAAIEERKNSGTKEQDYLQFLFNELEEAAFTENELESLEEELRLLNSSEGIKLALSAVLLQLKTAETPVVQVIKQVSQQLAPYTSAQTTIQELQSRLLAAQIELDDIAEEADRLSDKIQYDPERIAWIDERLNLGYRLLKKHGFQSTSQLLNLQSELQAKLGSMEELDEQINAIKKQLAASEKKMKELADKLSDARRKQLTSIEKQVTQLLDRVGMPNARLKIQLDKAEPGPHGTDSIDFLFDANKSNQFAPIRKVASGGELSRLMLCIKSLVAKKINLPTLLFDEIDTGISGEASRQVGLIMKELASSRQVICITHQPQIAGKADRHLFVYKEKLGKNIQTNIKSLTEPERITAIAQMLGGDKPSAIAIENARELIMNS
ncbi:DNA repair protein RecN [Flavihumibacter sp. UBA7668]|uniref:DNA repair protein RecN n=1 Tax=Flavihumibacter sp. UBA7668 TaxID=1946542 RepID=UPI0025C68F54|nr:DNA repair protein RecN [Flavihumibacter sp. UBA7668]